MSNSPDIPIACDLSAIQVQERAQHEITGREIFAAVQEVRELPNGYAFRLPPQSTMLRNVAEFIASERLCCPFFGFGLELESNSAALWLHLTGNDDVKQFIQGEMMNLVSQPVAEAARVR